LHVTIPRQLAFERGEFEERLRLVRERMQARRLDALLLFGPGNIYYLSGHENDNLADVQCLVVPAAGEPVLVLFFFEAGRAANTSWLENVVLYGIGDDPVRTIADLVGRLGLSRGRVAIERPTVGLTIDVFERLTAALSEATIEDSFGVVEPVRRTKSSAEIGYMRRAADLTDRAVDAACAMIEVGVADSEIAAVIVDTMYRGGGETTCLGPIVATGYRSGAPHSSFNGTRVAAGDAVFLEFTAQVRRYAAPIMRTVHMGPPSAEIERIADAGARSVEAVIATARPGVPAGDVARAGLAELEGVLPGLMFHHTFGYPVGIGFPFTWTEALGYLLRAENTEPLEAGMTFHLPISLRRFGEFGVNQSHTILVTESGAEPLTRSTARLLVKDVAARA
jgi:Xaa-Pro dipeptidase